MPGQAVFVPFGPRILQGVVLDLLESSDVPETREIEAIAEDTTPSTTDASQNPVCKGAKRIVDLNKRIDSGLNKAVTYRRTSSVLKALRALPVTDLRNAYDDLSAELSKARRRRLAVDRKSVV